MRRTLDTQAPKTETTEPIHVRYRPKKLADVLGQKPIVKSLEAALRAKARPHAFLFTGPRGTGKTTLARILASEFGCDASGLIEVDAASTSGVDDMRAVTSTLRYTGFGEHPSKAIIIDECHRLSKQAWDSLLKSVEEPPAHVFFFFCSTEGDKVPGTITSRCSVYNLALLKYDDLMDLLEDVCESERYKTPSGILDMVVRAAEGSARSALTMLATVHDCDLKEAEVLLQQPLDNKEVIDLCRMLIKGELSWGKLTETLKLLKETPPETIRILIVNYLNACAMGARNEKDAMRVLDMMEAFSKPCNPSDKLAPILIAFGRIIYG